MLVHQYIIANVVQSVSNWTKGRLLQQADVFRWLTYYANTAELTLLLMMKAVGEVEISDKRIRDVIFLAWEPLWAVHYCWNPDT